MSAAAARRRAMQARFERGRQGEEEAEAWLAARGFEVLDAQLTREAAFLVNGRRRVVRVRADLMVSRRGRRYVVEVKTGRAAPRPTTTATRRQLLEYAHVFACDGVLLADMESRRLMAIEFPPLRAGRARAGGARRGAAGLRPFLWGVAVGACVMLYWLQLQAL